MDTMTDEERFAAISARDARFDGIFFTCVRTTGIFCRPSCPARTPSRANVEFAASAAAALDAGFRACKRCSPSAPPGSPDADPAESLARRALDLIESGGLDDGAGVGALASRLHVTERTLHRALLAATGASALSHARMRRSRRAHELLRTTDLPLARIAYAAGFGSERQFHDTFRRVYGQAPSALRAASTSARSSTAASDGAVLTARPAVRLPFDGAGLARWFAARAIPGTEAVEGLRWRRAVRLPHGPAVLEVELLPRTAGSGGSAHLPLTARLADLRDYSAAVALARRMLDLDADPVGIDAALSRALPALAPLVAHRPGVRIPGLPTMEEALLRAIVGQQISTRRARDLLIEAQELLGEPLPEPLAADGITHLLAPSAALADRADDWFRGPASRRRALVAALRSGIDPAALGAAELEQALLALPGVGPWTAQYAMLRAARAVDVAPERDVALLRGAADIGLAQSLADLATALAPASPWRSYAALHLWHHAAALPAARPTPRKAPR